MQERYQILEKAGEGGAGAVFRAWDRMLEREVAVKRVKTHDDPQYQREIISALQREASALAALQHPNVVSLYDMGRDDDGSYVIMEFLNGEDLQRAVARGVLVENDFRRLASQVLQGLAAAHERGLLHSDLKPSNVRLTWPPGGEFVAKLVDFGLARFASRMRPANASGAPHERSWGTPCYMAPELFDKCPPTAQTDLYALGCLFYYVLTGRLAFDAPSMEETATLHRAHKLTRLEPQRPDLPPVLCCWVHWLMQPRPEWRPLNALCALRALEALPWPALGSAPHAPRPSGRRAA